MPTTITAALCRAHGQPLTIEQVTLADPGPGQARVTLEAVAICASDIAYAAGAWGGALPAIYGHEAVGRVAEAGAGCAHPAGTRVLVTLIRACNACPACTSGQPAYCDAAPGVSPLTTADGTEITQAMACGAFATEVTVAASQLAPIPDVIPAEAACLLSCGVITGIGAAVNTARVRPGQTVVVIGAGGVGLNAIQGARLAGAARVVAIDLSAEKLADARAFGATDTIPATDPKPWKTLARIAPRMADAVLICTGAIGPFNAAPRLQTKGGRMVMVGMPATGAMAEYEPAVIASLGQSLIGSKMGDTVLARDIPWLVDLYQQGRLQLDSLVTGRWRLDQINEAIADTKAGRARRNVILFD